MAQWFSSAIAGTGNRRRPGGVRGGFAAVAVSVLARRGKHRIGRR